MQDYEKQIKCELYHDNFQNWKSYNIPKAQLVIADIPYNLGGNAYASNPTWYVDGDNSNGESDKAGKSFFHTDGNFKIAEYMHFCSRLLKKEPKETNSAPAMIVFCAFEQMHTVIEYGKKYGFMKSYPLIFVKNYSSQVLKSNMKIVGATEYAVVLYRNKLPKFKNDGKMIFNWFRWERETNYPKIHPTQKPVYLLRKLIEIFTDPGDVVIDPCAGSGSTLVAARECGRNSYGFEVDKKFYQLAQEKMLSNIQLML
ncbi:MAG: site-specific DNA-methyltransferase [Oscillospiraceae bacterium]|nr:site-specific DNA-methyltransferase [Oscillospiraceae bacterium]